MEKPEAWKPAPNCAYVQSEAERINQLDLPFYEKILADNGQRLQTLDTEIPEQTNELANDILRQEFLVDGPPSESDEYVLMARRMLLKLSTNDQRLVELLSSGLRDAYERRLQRRAAAEARIDRHVAVCHRGGAQECYRTSDFDAPAVRVRAAALRAGDNVMRKIARVRSRINT